jgi:hypothetical protein
MIKLKYLLTELRAKEPLIKLFANTDLLDNGKYKNLLIHYIDTPSLLDDSEFTDLVKWLIQNKSLYDNLKPKSGYAYRGTSITPKQYHKIKNGLTSKLRGYTVIQAPYISVNEAQSWTYDFKVAQRFAERGLFNNPRIEEGAKPAIIRVKIDNNFVGSPSLTSIVADQLSLKSEKEIFHLGSTIQNAEWMIPSADILSGKFDK